ncbi:Hypothetical Protein FCC1311_114982 [Hondaea fermentalgiana]|uniref:Uncharacterized protein n=1 Tax=Hondaea fermentalgiana TaxID=2315210 RepID=A0A2R5GXH8_9STRA|nr:Hypothetical Protein FCC1311_114982 [Hondaea fermentalgiana]|eukprot:GBG35275.1 Hypothetical Protein FCC1311_114982 [Hondaea fermentalgiana]
MMEEDPAGVADLDDDVVDVGLDDASVDEHSAIDDLPSSRLRLEGSFRTLEEATGERNRAAHFRENVLSQMCRFIAKIESLPLECSEPRASLFQKHLNDLAAESWEAWTWIPEQCQSRLIQFAQEQRDRHHRNQLYAVYMTSQRDCADEIRAEIEERS